MVSVTAGQSPKVAANYFREHLMRDDYYSKGERIHGEWVGEGARRLGLHGEITQEDFLAVIGNDLERFGQQSRPRRSKNCHYDFTFTAPKSVSILSMRDERIRELHLKAVKKAFAHMESLARVRDRRGELVRSESTRTTNSLAAGLFVHESSRSNDPNLHVHAVLANLSFDPERNGWLALQAAEMYRQRKLLDKIALAELAHGLRGLGYELDRTEYAFEVRGVGSALLERFSQRRAQVQRLAEELRADSTRLALLYVKYKLKTRLDALAPSERASVRRAVGSLTDAEVRELATLETRPEKEAKTRRELLDLMDRRLSAAESRHLDQVIQTAQNAAASGEHAMANGDSPTLATDSALRYALDHELERASAVSEPRLLETLLHHGIGSVRFDEARAALENGPVIYLNDGQAQRRFVTTPTVLAEERAVVNYVRGTRGTCRQLDSRADYQPLQALLSEEQSLAVTHIRTSRDRVMAIRGIAGTGKTTLLRETIHALQQAGHEVFLFAPSSEASRGVLRKEATGVLGDSMAAQRIRHTFQAAETVEKLLTNADLQVRAAGQVLWIDEAGLLSMPAMHRIFDLAERLRCRVVLAGDTAQHTAVERGDALRILEKHAGLVPAELSVVRRQRLAAYRRMVEAFAAGDVERGCRRLRKLGAWREISDPAARYEQLGSDYAQLVAQGKEVLAVSPTHAEGNQVVQAIREQLRATGVLTGEEHHVERLVNLHLTTAQKTASTNYRPGQFVQFVRRCDSFSPGERAEVVEALDPGHLLIQRADGRRERLVLNAARAFAVYEAASLAVSVGDKIRITQNGFANAGGSAQADAFRIDNGTLLTVTGFSPRGDLECAGGLVVPRSFGHLASGYCLTSHASQGKTVDHVLLAESGASAESAGSLKQGYVSLSRGREDVRIYTDDRQAVEAAWTDTGERRSALDLVVQQRRSERRRRSVRQTVHLIAAKLARRVKQVIRRGLTGKHPRPAKPVVPVGPGLIPRIARQHPRL